jgi:hypothetical protein
VERARRWKAREQLNRKLGEVTWLPRRDETSCALQDSIVLSTRVCHQIPLSRNRVTLGSVGCVFSEQGYGTGTKGQLLHTAEDDFAGWPVLLRKRGGKRLIFCAVTWGRGVRSRPKERFGEVTSRITRKRAVRDGAWGWYGRCNCDAMRVWLSSQVRCR